MKSIDHHHFSCQNTTNHDFDSLERNICCLSSIPGQGGAAEFWHWDSITYVGNFIIRFWIIVIFKIIILIAIIQS